MGKITTTLRTEAESIFTDLGYKVAADDSGLRAERKWRVVDVMPMAEPEELPSSGQFRCFVTWEDAVDTLAHHLADVDPDYEWAIIGVGDEDYEVSHPPTTRLVT
jgi:hypothetical protein